uniref:Reverse transcriptase Ty1/copia-type domain-containing protein n=1 Tax=Lactuca sativa TaxID=4236 RepID=A0A9R1VQ87_LACSA|nr:hypothetical protein LSAT_V11C400165950 [Lactuca sativa]
MNDEYSALIRNGTWSLVPRVPNSNVVDCKWVYKVKRDQTCAIKRYKAATTIRLVLSLVVAQQWHMRQLDVQNAFLHGNLQETVYLKQPQGFVDAQKPDHVCRLHKSLYGLKQAPRAWFQRLSGALQRLGFHGSKTDLSLFIYAKSGTLLYMLVYVDDTILTERAKLSNAKPMPTPIATTANLALGDSSPLADSVQYRQIVGALQYVTLSRPDIAYVVNKVRQFMHTPTENHRSTVKLILRYLKGTSTYGLRIHQNSGTSLHAYTDSTFTNLNAFSDADWAGCPDDRRSTGGGGGTPTLWCDNLGAIYLSANPMFHARTKHVEVDFHFDREKVAQGNLSVKFISTDDQIADIFTKPLSS